MECKRTTKFRTTYSIQLSGPKGYICQRTKTHTTNTEHTHTQREREREEKKKKKKKKKKGGAEREANTCTSVGCKNPHLDKALKIRSSKVKSSKDDSTSRRDWSHMVTYDVLRLSTPVYDNNQVNSWSSITCWLARPWSYSFNRRTNQCDKPRSRTNWKRDVVWKNLRCWSSDNGPHWHTTHQPRPTKRTELKASNTGVVLTQMWQRVRG